MKVEGGEVHVGGRRVKVGGRMLNKGCKGGVGGVKIEWKGHFKGYSITTHPHCTVYTACRVRSDHATANHFPKSECKCCNASLMSYASFNHLTDINTRISTSELTLKITFPWMHE